ARLFNWTTSAYSCTPSLHDALPILAAVGMPLSMSAAVGFIALLGQAVLNGVLIVSAIRSRLEAGEPLEEAVVKGTGERLRAVLIDRKSTRLNSSHSQISYAVFCLKQ